MNIKPAELTVDADFIAGQRYAHEEIVDQICEASEKSVGNPHHFILGAAALALHAALVATEDAAFARGFMDGISLGIVNRISRGAEPGPIN